MILSVFGLQTTPDKRKKLSKSYQFSHSTQGFTLVEMLVAMALLSLLMLGLAGALRTLAQTEERVDARIALADDLRTATQFLDTLLGQVSARRKAGLPREGESRLHFLGQSQAMAWLGTMPPRHGLGGSTLFRLALEDIDGDGALVLRFAPFTGGTEFPNWGATDFRVLVHGVTALSLHYEDPYQPQPQWVTQWTRPDQLPERLRIDLQTHSGAWPLWITPLRASTEGQRSRFSMGPSE